MTARPNFDDPYGLTTNPLRLIYMMGVVWRLAQDSLTRNALRHLDILEIGSWCGASALTWGEAIALYAHSGRLTCIDPWQPYTDLTANPDALNRAMNDLLVAEKAYEIFRANMAFLPAPVGLDIRRGRSADVLATLRPDSFDVVYIDGDHTYDAVRADIAEVMPLVRDGGVLCGDDLERQAHECDAQQLDFAPSVERVWDDRADAFFHPGVTRAVGEAFGPVSCWYGFWAMRKISGAWHRLSLDGMPARIPSHIPPKSLMGLKAFLMKNALI